VPELPEVETISRQLDRALSGRRIVRLNVYDPRLRTFPLNALQGYFIKKVFRLGKEAVFELNKNGAKKWLCFHLRMTGRLIYIPINYLTPAPASPEERALLVSRRARASLSPTTSPPLAPFASPSPFMERGLGGEVTRGSREGEVLTKHLRARLILDQGELHFSDVRRFGVMKLVAGKNDLAAPGLDPTLDSFTSKILESLLNGSSQNIKNWLMRQDKLTGIGNIYASEILFHAKINPKRSASTLTALEIKKLYRAIKSILKKAIKHCGTTFSDYRDSEGKIGSFQNFLAVYNREGEPCRLCKSPIIRLPQAGRSTYYCRQCQR
jgi:formamidopyrimidine-DNA glycosylase